LLIEIYFDSLLGFTIELFLHFKRWLTNRARLAAEN
jgi:hypothetical protein